MATVAERQAERERRRREAEERKKQKELAKQPEPDQVTVVGEDPNFQLGGGTFSILGIAENRALDGAQVISDQVQFKNAKDQRQFGGVVNQVVGGQPGQQNNQQAGQQPAGPNGQPNDQQAGAAGAQPGQDGQQPGQGKPAAEGNEPPDLLELADEDDIKVDVNVDAKGGKSRHRDFVNFLATDKVPDSIFGIPVVQDESQYTEKDLEFFKRNPKAAGFYDLGDEEVDEDVPQQAAGAGVTYDTPLTKDQEARYQKWRATLPKSLQYEGDYDLRGYWLDPGTVKDGIKDGQHFTDTYKKPNHPTFSVESKYAVGADLAKAGRWEGEKFIPPRGAYPGSLNNPGNVEKRKERRQGEIDSPHERWAKFATPQDGLREMADAIRQIAAVKLSEKGQAFTLRNFAEVYAPRVNKKGEKENDTDKYIGDLSADTGFDADEELHRFDESDMAGLLKSVVRFESGAPHSAWFTDEEYAEAAKKLQEGAVD